MFARSSQADMPRIWIVLLCLALSGGGVGLIVSATGRVHAGTAALARLATESRVEGQSFVDTLRGEHAELQRLAFERRRAAAVAMAAARRDRLLGVLLVVAGLLGAGGLFVMSRIAREIEEDRRHLQGGGGDPGPERSSPGVASARDP